MIPDALIVLTDAVTAVALAAALVLILLRARRFEGPVPLLLAAAVSIAMIIGMGNVLEWSNLLPKADILEDFIEPFLPTLWLFLFAVELERADRGRLHRSYERMAAVHSVASKLTVTMEPHAILDEIVDAASRLLAAPFVVVFTPENGRERLVARAFRGITPDEAATLKVGVGEGLAGRAFLHQRPYQARQAPEDFSASMRPLVKRHGLTHTVSIPLLFQDRAVGAMNVGRTRGEPFSDDDVRLLETLCAHAAVAIENARLYERLAESEAKYRVLVENAQVAIIVTDAHHKVIFWNRGAERLFGWAAGEVLGDSVDLVHPEDRRVGIRREVTPALERTGLCASEYPAVRKDGSQFTAFFSVSRINDSKGNVLCFLGIVMDVTERVQLREQLFQAQKMQTIGTLASGIAHDFNNLLTAIAGFAGLLQTSLAPGTDDYDSAASIAKAAERGTQLVRQLVSFSQKQPTTLEPVNLNEIVREAAEFIKRTFPKTTSLLTQLDPHLHTIQADPTQMHQVLMNLAVNARDAMPKGGAITITTENLVLESDDPLAAGTRAGPCVAVTVADTGVGIPPQDRPHIFEPFFTTKSASGGTGLGLSTVYAIVTRHGGRIIFKTQTGQGTTFRFILPTAPRPSPAPDFGAGSPHSTSIC